MRSLNTKHKAGKDFLANYTPKELREFLVSEGVPGYRATQVLDGFYANRAKSFMDLHVVPKTVRELLESNLHFSSLILEKAQHSADGTIKFLFRLVDGLKIEAVLIPSEMRSADSEPKRRTLCVSTQAGCPLGCEFCATATLNLQRNLDCAEIVDQVLEAERYSNSSISNVVYMGMGEPMLNYGAVMKSAEIISLPDNKLLAGIVGGILQMADEHRPFKLALSLHATTDKTRSLLMPIARKHSLQELGNALEYYYRSTHIPVTFEYILFDGLNDSAADVKRLAKLTRRVPTKVNVIPFHPIDFTQPSGIASTLKPTSEEKFRWFIEGLRRENVTVMIRASSGIDIDAACGQLALSEAVHHTATSSLAP
jgi:23S rRNA (adenine2503-C2)-methyltransferase